MKYKEYLKSPDWKAKRRKKLSRNVRCAICADPKVDIHHLNYKNLYDVEQTDLRKLCRRCHFLTHELHKKGLIKFRSTNHLSRFAIIKAAVKKYLGITKVNMFSGREQESLPTQSFLI